MLTEIVLHPDDKNPQEISFDDLFNYTSGNKMKNVKSFKAKVDTSDMSLSYLGDILPNLQIIRLDYSTICNLRDLSTPLQNLKVLSLTHCKITSIEGISTISCNVQELYLSFNLIEDISPLLGFNSLQILDLESNLIKSIEDVSLLQCCTSLCNLTLRGTGASENPKYREIIQNIIPQLQILDGIKYCEEKKNHFPSSQLQQMHLQTFTHRKMHIFPDQQKETGSKLPILKTSNPSIVNKKYKKQIKTPKVSQKIKQFKI